MIAAAITIQHDSSYHCFQEKAISVKILNLRLFRCSRGYNRRPKALTFPLWRQMLDTDMHESGSAKGRKEELVALYHELKDCSKCGLSETRTNVVFGTGNPDSDLMFIGEAPGFHEDQQAKPFVGQAGKLLDKLLGEIGLVRKQVFIANVLKCRPPDNRDPQADEVDACKAHLHRQVELIRPSVVCTLGNSSTKLLTGKPSGITKVHGTLQRCTIGSWQTHLYPMFHPAAALYTPSMLETLREDFRKLPEILEGLGPSVEAGAQDGGSTLSDDQETPEPPAASATSSEGEAATQMGLFQ